MGNYFRILSSRFGAGWTRFWFTPSDAIVLSLLRVLTAGVALWWYLSLLPDLQGWFGPNGMFSLEAAMEARNSSDAGGFAISLLDYVSSPSQLWVVYFLGVAALGMMLLGLFSRVTTIASLVFVLSFIHRAPILSRPVDDILPMLMFYLCLGPSGANFSLDALMRRRKQAATKSAASSGREIVYSSAATVAIRLVQIHLAMIFGAMVIAQLQGAAWWQGTALWWLMARPDSRLVDLTGLSRMGLAFEYLVNFFTHAIVLYELCFVFLIWNPLARPILLVLGAFVWAGLALVGGSVSFAVIMFVATLAFVSPQPLRNCCCGEKTTATQSKSSVPSGGKVVATARS
jgi:hypothetical protein